MNAPLTVPRLDKNCYLVLCYDDLGSAQKREEFMEGHLRHVEKNWQRYVTAGPMYEPDGNEIIGSVFLVIASSLEEAQTLMNGDPYITCGMYERIEYKSLVNAIGQYMNGKIWTSVEDVLNRTTNKEVVN